MFTLTIFGFGPENGSTKQPPHRVISLKYVISQNCYLHAKMSVFVPKDDSLGMPLIWGKDQCNTLYNFIAIRIIDILWFPSTI